MIAMASSIAGETQHLHELRAMLLAIAIIGYYRIEEVEFLGFRPRVLRVGKQGRHRPYALRLLSVRIEERAGCLLPVPEGERQVELVEQQAGVRGFPACDTREYTDPKAQT